MDASNSSDTKIATDLRRYLDQFGTEWMRDGLLHGYCGKNDSPKRERICEGIRSTLGAVAKVTSVEVSDGVITLHTGLTNDEPGRMGARELCGEIQGADVADFTRGHTVLDDSGQILLVCPTREEIDNSPNDVYYGEG